MDDDNFSPRKLLKALWQKPTPVSQQPAARGGVDPLLPTFWEATENVTLAPRGAVAAALRPGSQQDDEFRMLRARVRNIGEQKPFRVIGIVSAAAGEGKTTVALGLAWALAQDPDRRVLIMEADLRKPAIEGYLGLEPTPGLAEWLQTPSEPLTLRRLSPSLRLIPAGLTSLECRELLESKHMTGMVDAARHRYDYVIVDCPPLIVADTVILQDLFDGFLLVVRARQTPREAVASAVAQLKPDRIQGVVFNDQREFLRSSYGYGYTDRGGRKRFS